MDLINSNNSKELANYLQELDDVNELFPELTTAKQWEVVFLALEKAEMWNEFHDWLTEECWSNDDTSNLATLLPIVTAARNLGGGELLIGLKDPYCLNISSKELMKLFDF